MSQARVTVIPPRINLQLVPFSTEYVKKRVAAYARVSTDTEEQLSSYEAQVDHYTRHIQANDEWEFVKVYTDEGISATSTTKRDGFRQMVQDALDGKIDLIITKSVRLTDFVNRPHHYKVGEPVCPKHGGQFDNRPAA